MCVNVWCFIDHIHRHYHHYRTNEDWTRLSFQFTRLWPNLILYIYSLIPSQSFFLFLSRVFVQMSPNALPFKSISPWVFLFTFKWDLCAAFTEGGSATEVASNGWSTVWTTHVGLIRVELDWTFLPFDCLSFCALFCVFIFVALVCLLLNVEFCFHHNWCVAMADSSGLVDSHTYKHQQKKQNFTTPDQCIALHSLS